MNVPDENRYTTQHEWVRVLAGEETAVGARCRVGITEFAGTALGDVVFVEVPAVGSVVRAGETCGEIESTKSVSDLFSPLSGTVLSANEIVVQDPSLINSDPYGLGWLFELEVSSPDHDLLTASQYRDLVDT